MRGVVRKHFAAARADVSAAWQHISKGTALLANISEKYWVLPIAYGACLAAIVLTNDYDAPRTIYFLLVLPIFTVVSLAFAGRMITTSLVFWTVAIYLLAMGLASLVMDGIPAHSLSRHFRLIPLILSFLIVIGFLASDPKTLKQLMLVSCVLLAVSAAINMFVFFAISDRVCSVNMYSDRLCAVLGMFYYRNSTNISAPYAIYCVGALAALTRADLNRTERVLFAAAAVILLLGVLATQSRSGMVAVFAGLALVTASAGRWSRFALFIVAIAVIVAISASPFAAKLLLERGASYRPEIWGSFWALGWERPLLGHGILDSIDRQMSDGYVADQAHNLVLSAFVRGGAIGAIAMGTAIGAALYWAARYWIRTRQAIPIGLIVAMTTVGMFDYELLATYPTWPWITFWFPLGVCVGIETIARRSTAAL